MIELIQLRAVGKKLSKSVVPEDFTECSQSLLENLLAVRNKQQLGSPTLDLTDSSVVERGHDGLARSRRSYNEVSRASVLPLNCELVEHLLLVDLRLEIKESWRRN